MPLDHRITLSDATIPDHLCPPLSLDWRFATLAQNSSRCYLRNSGLISETAD